MVSSCVILSRPSAVWLPGAMLQSFAITVVGLFVLMPEAAIAAEGDESAADVRFSVDVRPVLADACWACHGPDGKTREVELRLDTEEGLFAKREDITVVIPGQPAASELYRRITSDDPDVRMPPPDAERQLSAEQVGLLKRWIEEGAAWEGHWAFEPVRRSPLPRVSRAEWRRNAIDAFVLARLDREPSSPSAEASPETLLRRVTLDLTGLPPTPEQIDAYLADTSPDRYGRLVDRLLASPSYGEHMAVAWLDAARYADTSGYQTDGTRAMFRWRDWLIAALNADMPFDQFTIEQLAGDLLPNATLDQRIATGFHRNHRANSEGGSIPEEFLVEYVVDRVDTTGTVWLGLTIGCARCHEHKYDPISQKEYYELFAYFNQVPEKGRVWKEGNAPPYVLSPTPTQQMELRARDEQIAAAKNDWEDQAAPRRQAQRAWEQSVLQDEPDTPVDWTVTDGLIAWYPLESDLCPSVRKEIRRTETTIDFNNDVKTGKDEAHDESPVMSAGTAQFVEEERPGLRLDGGQFVDAGDVANFGYFESFTVAAWIKPRGDMTGGIVTRTSDDSDRVGWALHLDDGHVQVHLTNRWLDDALRVQSAATLDLERWQHVLMTYDGSRLATGVQVFIDGEPQETEVLLDMMNQTMVNTEPLRIGSTGALRPFAGDIADVRIYNRELSGIEATVVAVSKPIATLLRIPPEERTFPQASKVREHFLLAAGPDGIRQSYAELRRLQDERKQFVKSLPTTMVMMETPEPRQTFVLSRGSYEKPTVPVSASIPDALSAGMAPAGSDRLALARWLVDPSHPLTPRVAVNREWQRFFGTGIVKTAEDFGTQGERPSHPALLDWLATEFIRTDWDVKGLHRLIVTSATYRQSSAAPTESIAADPENRLLARGPRFRMTAEMIRDLALAASGLLQPRIGGPSVKPYQPEGLWSEISSATEYVRSPGPDAYRRSLYTFWKRTVTNPTLGLFDATTRETCIVRRSRTNTPLQALTLMNDVTFVEAARVLAERTLREAGPSAEDRIALLFRRLAGRAPSAAESEILAASIERHRQHFAHDTEAAKSLLDVGDTPAPANIDPSELAAYTAVASVILNLDEVVTKE